MKTEFFFGFQSDYILLIDGIIIDGKWLTYLRLRMTRLYVQFVSGSIADINSTLYANATCCVIYGACMPASVRTMEK